MGLLELSALELGRKIQEGEVSVREAIEAALASIAQQNEGNNAFITVLQEQALAEAEEVQKKLSAGELSGPLAGVPMGVKDNICTRGIKTTCASKILGDFKPAYDATIMEKLHQAGGVMLGKLNMDEFA
ncbi:MAG: amidase, partial [Candidatus Onthomonas sp.]|nr:amidase [Candidatus Onthomonas sp.]